MTPPGVFNPQSPDEAAKPISVLTLTSQSSGFK